MKTKNYQYGSSPENIVALTEKQARAVNGFVFHRDESIEIEHKNGKARLVGEIELPDDAMYYELVDTGHKPTFVIRRK